MLKKSFLAILMLTGTIAVADIVVSTTIYPLYSIVKEVAKERVTLHNLIPFGTKAHGFDPSAQDMAKLSKSDIFILSSNTMEPWSDKIVKSLKIQNKVFDMSQHVKLRKIEEKDENHADKRVDKNLAIDPHYWVSLENYILMTKMITKLLIEKDGANKEHYEKNSAEYLAKVAALKSRFDSSMITCTNKKILVNHDAFGYFADDYGVKQYSISGITPEDKPSAKKISELIKLVKKEKINTVFFEEFASPKVAQTIANEARVKTDTLRPAENITEQENEKGYGYLQIMEENLEKLKFAMNCK